MANLLDVLLEEYIRRAADQPQVDWPSATHKRAPQIISGADIARLKLHLPSRPPLVQFTKPQVIDLHAIVLLRLTEKCLAFSTPLIFRVSHRRFMSSKSHETSVPAHAVMASSKTAHTRRCLSDSSRARLVSCPDIKPFRCSTTGLYLPRREDTPG